MKKPELDVYTLSAKLASALDNRDWAEVEECFRSLLDHKKALNTYNSKK
jgi:hypothetical protein